LRIDEVVGHKGYAIGFEELIAYLKRVLPHSEVIEKALRREVIVYIRKSPCVNSSPMPSFIRILPFQALAP